MVSTKLARILGTAAYVPSKRLTNRDFESLVDTTEEWIVTRTGMQERRIARDDEFASDMGYIAAIRALEETGLSPDDIDLIAVATTTPDYPFPSTAALIQQRLGCQRAAAFDFQAACTGYLYGLAFAKGLVESGSFKNVLVIATEKLSSIVDYTDRSTCILFGDGAAASVVSIDGPGLAIEHVRLGTDGEQSNLLIIPGGGCRNPPSIKTVEERLHFIKMQGREIFKHAVRRMIQAMQESMEELGLKEEEIAWLVPHQANVRIIHAIAKRFDIPLERVWMTVERYGNTSASSVPIALCDLMAEHTLEKGSYLVLPSFGAGLTWGTAILRQL